ncbi:flagellar hook assembly protein FlgD [Georgenia subflava]|uniref:Flagellar hook capping protein n=1 Tax=Georgenia subflava TaxID=1622177 RepID=A0A6N7EQ25_9MICO|nr:flagellar hook capping FlgD N-terminal domain-containing protein [Georgenia subflava]MPV38997.1 flagellar hook capping protein [Georgenia subflava]
MTVNPVSGLTAQYTAPPATEAPTQTLDKDAFLQLLVASLKYQDPSEPLSTSELMAQTTQLATMEQLTEMTQLSQQTFALQQRGSAAGLVGQQVAYFDGEKIVSGTVDAVDLSGEVPVLVVGGVGVPLDAISAIAGAPTGGAPTDPGDDASPETDPDGADDGPADPDAGAGTADSPIA